MVAAEPILDVRDLHVRFGRQQVLRDIDLTVTRGETLAVIGESGCGMTVLLKTLIGLIQPQQGHVEFDGQRIDQLTEQQLAEQRTRFGFVFQQAALFDSLTIEQNIAFPLTQQARQDPAGNLDPRSAHARSAAGRGERLGDVAIDVVRQHR